MILPRLFFLLGLCFFPVKAHAQDRHFDIRIVFGYKDTRPARYVGDRYERLYLVAKLIQPCVKKEQACGFTRDAEDAESLVKNIARKNKQIRLRIKIAGSSAGADDAENRRNAYQRTLSENAQRLFLSGLESADVVFYVGHSRDGGGPDFAPPRLAKDNQPDYDFYREQQPGLKAMQKSLHQRAATKKLYLGVFSCSSKEHFGSELPRKKDWKVMTLSKPVYFMDALERTSQELSHVIQQLVSQS
jgi:hypothetical protein